MNSHEPPPRVSIGLPVQNGERYLRGTIDSLLNQTFRNFELILCDNASADQTEQICREYATRDARIRYYRSPYRMPAAENFSRAFHLSRGHYFKWAADEVCAVRLLEEAVRTLDADPIAAMAFADESAIDSVGNRLATDSPHPARRYRALIFREHQGHGRAELFGVYRRSVLARTNLLASVFRDQSPLLVRCALMGRFIRIEGGFLKHREHGSTSTDFRSTRIQPDDRASLFSAVQTGPARWRAAGPLPGLILPEWTIARDYLYAISQTPISRTRKGLCRFWWTLFAARNVNKFGRELLMAAKHAYSRASHRRWRPPLVPRHQGPLEVNFDPARNRKSTPQIDARECSLGDAEHVMGEQMSA
jgi:glycosyltransferase involved in cell wall biosynthesis